MQMQLCVWSGKVGTNRMRDGGQIVTAYLDSNVFIYFFEGRADEAIAARNLLSAAKSGQRRFVTSELTLAEVLAPASERIPLTAGQREQYIDLIARNETIDIRPVTREILFSTAEMRRFTRHKLPDAIHCATAVNAGCRYMVSHDRQMARMPGDMTWIDVTVDGVNTLVEAIDAAR